MPKPKIIVDTREQKPHKFHKSKNCLGMEQKKLDFGDYTIEGLENFIIIERKQSIDELCGNIGKNRKRFEKELERMQVCRYRFIVVEDYLSSIYRRTFSRMKPNAVFETIWAWELKYDVRFIFAGTRKMAHKIIRSLLLRAHKYKEEGKI